MAGPGIRSIQRVFELCEPNPLIHYDDIDFILARLRAAIVVVRHSGLRLALQFSRTAPPPLCVA